MLDKIVTLNKKASNFFDGLLPGSATKDGLDMLIELVVADGALEGSKVIHDFGGGKHPFVGSYIDKPTDVRMFGFDIDIDQLNASAPGIYDKTIQTDLSQPMKKLRVPKADLSFCVATLEHVSNSEVALQNIYSQMNPGAKLYMFLPNRNSSFARLNMIIPEKLKIWLLRTFHPETGELQGFKAYYDRCTPAGVERMCRENGFTSVRTEESYNSFYFKFFAPLHIAWRLIQMLVKLIFGRAACETFVVIATK